MAVLAASGIAEPFAVQQAAIGPALGGRDLLGQGRTGSGKTLAFGIPLIARLGQGSSPRAGRPQALVLVPTRELASQVAMAIAPLARARGLSVTTIFGGVGPQQQRQQLARGVGVIVACPGRLLDHLRAGSIDLADLKVCVIDEADHMADQGFLPDVRRIMDRVPHGAQRMLFSATLADGVDALVDRYLRDPAWCQGPVAEEASRAEHRVVLVGEQDRAEAVARLAGPHKSVVFCRTKHRAKQLTRKLVARGVPAVELHGNLSQAARERNLGAFSRGTAQVLVATDIAARGIHVDHVDRVIHADPPIEHKAYTHRSGRTARAGAGGEVYTLASPEQVAGLRQVLARALIQATWDGDASARAAADMPQEESRRQADSPGTRGGREQRADVPAVPTVRRPRKQAPRRGRAGEWENGRTRAR